MSPLNWKSARYGNFFHTSAWLHSAGSQTLATHLKLKVTLRINICACTLRELWEKIYIFVQILREVLDMGIITRGLKQCLQLLEKCSLWELFPYICQGNIRHDMGIII